MAGRASIVGAAATHVGNVRDHNEDAHFIDVDLGLFLVCDGMGGHAAGEVASDLAIQALRIQWGGQALQDAVEGWLERGTAEAKKQLLDAIRGGVVAAHESILAEAERDETKSGMGTTLVGAVSVGGELVFAHAGDSRAYLVRDGISMQLTEDHTLLARLLAAGIDVDVSGEGARFRSMLTNALGIGDEVKVSTFVVPLADGDRFLLCSDGISEYVPENEVGEVLTKQPSPARAAQRLIDLALERGGGDNATAVVIRVLEAGETPLPAEQRKKDDAAIGACALWGKRVTPQQRLRALRIAIPRDHSFGEKLPPHALGDRVAWIVLDGEVVQDGESFGPGALIYPESLLSARDTVPPPGRDAQAITRSDVRALAIRANDFRELCDDDGELGEALLDSLAALIARRKLRPARDPSPTIDPRGNTDPQLPVVRAEAETDYAAESGAATDPDAGGPAASGGEPADARDRAATIPDEPTERKLPPRQRGSESSVIAPAPPSRPSPPPQQVTKRVAVPVPARPGSPAQLAPPARAPTRPSPPPGQLVPVGATPTAAVAPSPAEPAAAPPAPQPKPPQPPARPSPLPRQLARPASQPSAPSPPSASPAHPVARTPTPARGVVSPHTTPARGVPRTPTPAHGVVARSAAPATSPSVHDEITARQAPSPLIAATRTRGESPWGAGRSEGAGGASSDADDTARGRVSPPRGFARALTPPAKPRRPGTPLPLRPDGGRLRPPTDPEIETYLEIEADLPPEPGAERDVESELALRRALTRDSEEHESVSITIEEEGQRVTETTTETEGHTLTVTVTEPFGRDEVQHAITAEDAPEVSGTISIPEDTPPPPPLRRRARRQSEGWEE